MAVYLLHATRKLGTTGSSSASHYLGWVEDSMLGRRIELHRSGRSRVKIIEAYHRIGATLLLVRTWPQATPALERYLKRQGHLPRLCPLCREAELDHKRAMRRARRQRSGLPLRKLSARRRTASGGDSLAPNSTQATTGAGAFQAELPLDGTTPSGSISPTNGTGGTSLPATAPLAKCTNG